MVTIQTHQAISREHFGTPVYLEAGSSRVELLTNKTMAVDETGLILCSGSTCLVINFSLNR